MYTHTYPTRHDPCSSAKFSHLTQDSQAPYSPLPQTWLSIAYIPGRLLQWVSDGPSLPTVSYFPVLNEVNVDLIQGVSQYMFIFSIKEKSTFKNIQ